MALTADQLNTIYQNVLFRNVDQGGIQFFANRTDISDAQVRQQIELSSEASSFVSPIVRLYQEVLGRVPDVSGLKFFSGQLRGGASLSSVAQQLISSQEFTNKTAGTGVVDSGDFSNTNQLVTDAFTSILGRQPSSGEFAFFQGQSPAQILAGVAGSAEAAQTNAAAVVTFLDSAAVGSPNSGPLNSQTGSTGGTGTGTNAGTTITLTANTDGPGAPSPAANTTGTSGNDTYVAATGTLTSADSIDGGAGNDTLNYRITAAGGNVAPVLTNVENVVVTNITGAGSSLLNLASATGVTSLIERGSTLGSTTIYTNVGSSVALGLDAAKGAELINISGASSRTGNADVLSLNVANGTGAANNFNQLSITTAAQAADNSFEVLKIATSSAASYVNLAAGGTNISSVTVTGSSAAATTGATKGYGLSLTEAGVFANVKTIDASGMTGTGGLNISTTLAQDVTFTGSAVNDRLNVTAGAASITTADKFAFGAGTDTLAIGTDTAETGYTAGQLQSINAATGLERIEFTQAGFTALKANDFTSVNAFEFSGGGTSNLAITGVESADTYAFSASHVGTVNFTGTAVAQAANVIETGGVALTGAVGTGVVAGAGGTGAAALAFTSNITTLSLNSTGDTANSIVGGTGLAGVNAVNTGGNGGVAIDNGTAVQSVTITGDQNLTISGGQGGAAAAADGNGAGAQAAGNASVNAFSGAVSVDATSFTGKLSIQGSTGNDIIKLGVATTGDSSLTGNFVRGGAGADSITLNTGIDRLDYRTASDSIAATFDTVTNFTSGTDKFIVGVTVTGVGTAAVNGTGTLATDLTAALSANAGNGFGAGNNASVVTITGGTDAGVYAVVNTNTGGGNAGYDAADLVVKLVGTTSLAVADFTQTVTA